MRCFLFSCRPSIVFIIVRDRSPNVAYVNGRVLSYFKVNRIEKFSKQMNFRIMRYSAFFPHQCTRVTFDFSLSRAHTYEARSSIGRVVFQVRCEKRAAG